MRFRSVAVVVAMSGVLAGSLLRCALPELPPGPQANATRIALVRGALISLPGPGKTLDRAALVASMKELKFNTVILQGTADETGERVADRVAFAIELQRELDADVFLGTYESTGRNGKPMEELLQRDPAFSTCYPPDGPRLDADTSVIDKLRLCSQDVSKKIVSALTAVNASPRIGCYIAQQPELVDTLTNEGRSKLEALFRDSASACSEAKRFVGVSPVLSSRSGDPSRAGLRIRETIQDSGVNVVMLQDGVGTFDPLRPQRATAFYQGLRNALADRPPLVAVWANVEAFECEDAGCATTHPTTAPRFIDQLCGARARVEGIVTREYLHDLAGQRLTPIADASSDAAVALDDLDASAQLRRGYLEWADAGASCR